MTNILKLAEELETGLPKVEIKIAPHVEISQEVQNEYESLMTKTMNEYIEANQEAIMKALVEHLLTGKVIDDAINDVWEDHDG